MLLWKRSRKVDSSSDDNNDSNETNKNEQDSDEKECDSNNNAGNSENEDGDVLEAGSMYVADYLDQTKDRLLLYVIN